MLPLSSCISVKAPDKPIEINLNVTIQQEVLVRLQRDVQQLIQQNPQAFPPAPPSHEDGRGFGAGVAAVASVSGGAVAGGRRGAIAAGAVGERYDGYMGVVGAPPPRFSDRSRAINIRRRTLYIELADAQGRQPAGCRHHRRLPVAGARRRRRSLFWTTAYGGGARRPGRAGAGLLPLRDRGLPRLTIQTPVHKGSAPWRCSLSAMFLVLAWPREFQQGRRTGETHGRGRDRRGPEASTRRTARIAR